MSVSELGVMGGWRLMGLADAKPEVFKNAPLCLQLVGRRNADDQLLDVLEKISEVLPLSA